MTYNAFLFFFLHRILAESVNRYRAEAEEIALPFRGKMSHTVRKQFVENHNASFFPRQSISPDGKKVETIYARSMIMYSPLTKHDP